MLRESPKERLGRGFFPPILSIGYLLDLGAAFWRPKSRRPSLRQITRQRGLRKGEDDRDGTGLRQEKAIHAV